MKMKFLKKLHNCHQFYQLLSLQSLVFQFNPHKKMQLGFNLCLKLLNYAKKNKKKFKDEIKIFKNFTIIIKI
jgi:hypothetical protein